MRAGHASMTETHCSRSDGEASFLNSNLPTGYRRSSIAKSILGEVSAMRMRAHIFDSPVGEVFVAVNDDGELVRLDFLTHKDRVRYLEQTGAVEWDDAALSGVKRQVDEYFGKRRRDFDLPLAPEGTEFQQRVWMELRRIPYGTTLSY